jgi:hypothetical protein
MAGRASAALLGSIVLIFKSIRVQATKGLRIRGLKDLKGYE